MPCTREDETNHATREGGAALRPIYKRFPRSQHAASARPPMPTRRAVASRPHAARLRGPPRANARNRAAYGNIPPTWPGDPPWFQSEKRLHNMPNAKHPPGASVAASALASDSTEPPSSDTVKRPMVKRLLGQAPFVQRPGSAAPRDTHTRNACTCELPVPIRCRMSADVPLKTYLCRHASAALFSQLWFRTPSR